MPNARANDGGAAYSSWRKMVGPRAAVAGGTLRTPHAAKLQAPGEEGCIAAPAAGVDTRVHETARAGVCAPDYPLPDQRGERHLADAATPAKEPPCERSAPAPVAGLLLALARRHSARDADIEPRHRHATRHWALRRGARRMSTAELPRAPYRATPEGMNAIAAICFATAENG